MTTDDFLPFGQSRFDVSPDRDPIRSLLSSLWTDLVWTVERAVSVEIHRNQNEPEDERRELGYLPGDIDDALQHLARLIELLLLGHKIDWRKIGPNRSAIRGGPHRTDDIQPVGTNPLDPTANTDPIRFLLNSGKEHLVRLDGDTTEYRRIRHTGGLVADALTQKMSAAARGASAALGRASELLLLGYTIDRSKSGPTTEQLRTFKSSGAADWLAAWHPSTLCAMLRPLDYGVSVRFPARKWQLFSLACVRRISSVFADERTLDYIEALERYAEGVIGLDELKRQRQTNQHRMSDAHSHTENGYQALLYASHVDAQGAMLVASLARSTAENLDEEMRAQVSLVHEVFGNPYRVVPPDPAWLEWRGGTVEILARGIYEDRAFDRMPILGDALEDAGCTNNDILDHCRGPHEHVRGCWVLDLLLRNHFPPPPDEGTSR